MICHQMLCLPIVFRVDLSIFNLAILMQRLDTAQDSRRPPTRGQLAVGNFMGCEDRRLRPSVSQSACGRWAHFRKHRAGSCTSLAPGSYKVEDGRIVERIREEECAQYALAARRGIGEVKFLLLGPL